MDLYQTHADRWVIRDTPLAAARAVVRSIEQGGTVRFSATEFHVIPSAAPVIGEYDSLEAALDGVRASVGRAQRRPLL